MLDPLQCPRAYQAVDHVTTEVTYTTRKKSIDSDQSMDGNKKLLSIVDYDPAQLFVDELRVKLKKFFLFVFYYHSNSFRHPIIIKQNFFMMNLVVSWFVYYGNHRRIQAIIMVISIMLN
jgi:hypothetical protein